MGIQLLNSELAPQSDTGYEIATIAFYVKSLIVAVWQIL